MSQETEDEDLFGLVNTLFAEKFQIQRVAAEGGFGVVYAGHHVGLDIPTAVKILKLPEDLRDDERDTFLESFLAEARAMAKLRHPNIVQVLDIGVAPVPDGENVPWMAMEWLTGKTLLEDLRTREKGRSREEVLALMSPVFDALAWAHEQGIAHRDIKPGNIMLTEGRRGVVPKLLDFGLAKTMSLDEQAGSGNTLTMSALYAVSPAWAAPEQIGRARTGPWTDVHAMALILIALLTGKTPYNTTVGEELFARVVSRTRPSCEALGTPVGRWEGVLTRALAYRPDERFAHAGEFLQALEQALEQDKQQVALEDTMPAPRIPAVPLEVAPAAPPQPADPNVDNAQPVTQAPVETLQPVVANAPKAPWLMWLGLALVVVLLGIIALILH